MSGLPYRHICLDFHTSPLIPDVGSEFRAEEWAATLVEARVEWITLHAKCHHGMLYYPSRLGERHPGLRMDLFGQMREACRRHGIRVEAYISVVWDERTAERHPEWLQIDQQGRAVGRGPFDLEGRWRWLCMNTAYVDLVAAHTEEVLERYRPDGLLYDIVCQTRPGCCCASCLRSMREQGIDPTNASALVAYSVSVERAFMKRMSTLARARKPDITLWYNVRTLLAHRRADGIGAELGYLSHIELESLPSGIWGYNHFPLHVRYLATLGLPIKGQTGRFHRSWGDFGGIKNRAALEYECLSMLAHGAGCSVGDQMHPRGRLERPVYERIGEVFRQVEALEPWCRGAALRVDVAILAATRCRTDVDGSDSDEGALRVLQETHTQFHVVDREADFARYRVLVVPDIVTFDEELAAKIASFLGAGGSLLCSGESGLTPARDRFALKGSPVRLAGPGGFMTTFFAPRKPVAKDLEDMAHVVYERALDIEPLGEGAEILADRIDPYFDRTWEHFCSHAQSPPDRASPFPAAVRSGGIVHVSFPLFRLYLRHGSRCYRTLARNFLRLLLPDPLVIAEAPSTARITLLEQRSECRLVCHMLHYVPERRTKAAGIAAGSEGGWLEPLAIDVVEDPLPLAGIRLRVWTGSRPRRVVAVPADGELPFGYEGGYTRFDAPPVMGHAVVAIEL